VKVTLQTYSFGEAPSLQPVYRFFETPNMLQVKIYSLNMFCHTSSRTNSPAFGELTR